MARRLFRGDAYSENGWPYVDTGSCTWVRIPGAEHVSLQIQNGPPLQVIRAFAADYHAYVEPLRDADSACWTPDNTVRRSNHPAGTGADLNWQGPGGKLFRYGVSKEAAFPGAMARELDALYDFYEDNMFCGGYWSIRDWMHHQLGPNTYDQANDRPSAKIIDFIARKIRPDGFSTYRRGGATTPPAGANGVDVLARAAGISHAKATEILPTMQDGLRQAQCTNVNRIAMFIAQTGHESAGFARTEEYASGAAYEGRCRDLGNCQPGDGVRFKGRTWIQITGRGHYATFSQWAHARGLVPTPTYFVDHPVELQAVRWAGVGAAWYWVEKRPAINRMSDAGDIVGVTQAINGGQTGIADRRERYRRAINLGDQLLVLTATPLDPWEALLMSEPVDSWSIYATPGEPKIPPINLLRAIDAKVHRDLTDEDAIAGDPEAIRRVARTALGQGVNKSPGAVAHATRILNQIPEAYIDAANPGKQAQR